MTYAYLIEAICVKKNYETLNANILNKSNWKIYIRIELHYVLFIQLFSKEMKIFDTKKELFLMQILKKYIFLIIWQSKEPFFFPD